jgi:two-component system heavy metal sensor histidine kinase CusS
VTRRVSIGRRLSLWLALQSLVGTTAICTAVYWDARAGILARQSETLANKRVQVQHLVAEASGERTLEGLKHKLDDFFVGHDEVALTIRDGTHQAIYASSTLTAAPGDMRSLEFSVVQSPPASGQFRATLFLDVRDDELFLRRLGLSLLSAAIGGALLASLAGYWLVRQGLKPVRLLTMQTRSLTAHTLQRRLSEANQPAELEPLVAQFNELLGRLNMAYGQLEGFNADVAHELCTPLATLISSSELALRRSRDGPELADVISSNLEDLRRLAGIVQDMLFLSRADRGVRARRTQIGSLAALVRAVGEYHEANIEAAALRLQVEGDASGEFDVPLLQRALSNLLHNATRYATAGTAITVRIENNEPPGHVRVSVRDIGTQIASEDLQRIFDRFYRADEARPGSGGNHGLGLSIVAAIARMHDGAVFATSDARSTTVGVVLARTASSLDGQRSAEE